MDVDKHQKERQRVLLSNVVHMNINIGLQDKTKLNLVVKELLYEEYKGSFVRDSSIELGI